MPTLRRWVRPHGKPRLHPRLLRGEREIERRLIDQEGRGSVVFQIDRVRHIGFHARLLYGSRSFKPAGLRLAKDKSPAHATVNAATCKSSVLIGEGGIE